jgi:predicted methyltransferase
MLLKTPLLSAMLLFASISLADAMGIDEALAGEHRSAENMARDQYRKPKQVLEFFGLQSNMTVVEIWPGGGWYTEILAPLLKDEGHLVAAQYDLNGPYGYQRRGLGSFFSMLGKSPKVFSNVEVVQFSLPYKLELAKAGSADMVLTFRNVHNLVADLYGAGAYVDLSFTAMFDVLKPGGILGIVDHRWDDPANEDPMAKNGYISTQRTINFAKKAGFELLAESDVLRNPKDSKDHVNGVWSLPPVLAVDEKDKATMLAVGESDRFVLKFRKPIE